MPEILRCAQNDFYGINERMVLKNISLKNFRNYAELDLELSDLNLFVGENAQGKSNLLDAIYFLATSKSLRAERDSDVITQGQEHVRVAGEVAEEDLTSLEIIMQQQGTFLAKRLRVNGLAKRVVDYIGHLVVVYFVPEDINLVAGSPSLRRWHLDLTLAQVDRDYKRAITVYGEAVTSRNRILKRIREGLASLDELTFWTDQLLEQGLIITQKRQAFFDFLANRPQLLGQFSFFYHSNILSAARLAEYQSREIAAAASLIGPHRDDFTFQLNQHNLAHFGSRGEQRLAVLELKLAELDYIHQVKKVQPILLLDDVFSELDDRHQQQVAQATLGQQTLISAVENEKIPQQILDRAIIFQVKNGQLFSKMTGQAGKLISDKNSQHSHQQSINEAGQQA